MIEMLTEIRDANLTYLMLAQRMIRKDKPAAIFRLGITEKVADLLSGLSTQQVLRLSDAASMLARFRFDDANTLQLLTRVKTDGPLTQSHAAILLASQTVKDVH